MLYEDVDSSLSEYSRRFHELVVVKSVLIYRHSVLKSLEILLLVKAVKTPPKVQRTIEEKLLEL